MQLTLTKWEPCWVQISPAVPKFITAMKATVKKANYWKYAHSINAWVFHWKYLGHVMPVARKYYDYVDYATLPSNWQMVAAGASTSASESGLLGKAQAMPNPFTTLHIAEDAPLEVVKAAYKALAAKHHPDVGGNEQLFRKIDSAYRAILEARCA